MRKKDRLVYFKIFIQVRFIETIKIKIVYHNTKFFVNVITGQITTLGNGNMIKTLTNNPSNLSVGSTSSLRPYC